MRMLRLNPLLHQAVAHGVITEDTLAKIANTPGGEQFALQRMDERMQTDYQVDDAGQWMSRKTGTLLKNPPILVTPDDLKGISKVSRANAVSGLNLNLNLNANPKVQGYMVIDPTQVFANVDEAKAYRLQLGSGVVVLVREA